MRRVFGWIVMVLYCCPPLLGANYQKAEVVSMKTVSCDRVRALEPPGSVVLTPFFGGPTVQNGASLQPNDQACTAYELRTSKVVYHVMTEKNLILPVGETVQIRLTSREMNVHTGESEKDVRAIILEMSLVQASETKQNTASATKPSDATRRERTEESSHRTCLSNTGDVVPCLQ